MQSVAGYHVAVTDGDIGSVDEASYEVGSAYIVVDTGPWIFGHKVLVPWRQRNDGPIAVCDRPIGAFRGIANRTASVTCRIDAGRGAR